MPANTPNRSYTYATSDDANDLALISQRLAEQVDADVQAISNRLYGTDIPWTNMTLINSFTSYQAPYVPRYRKINGVVYLEGLVSRSTAPSAELEIAQNLPAPASTTQGIFAVTANNTGSARLGINVTNNSLRYKNGDWQTWISLYNVSYVAAN